MQLLKIKRPIIDNFDIISTWFTNVYAVCEAWHDTCTFLGLPKSQWHMFNLLMAEDNKITFELY